MRIEAVNDDGSRASLDAPRDVLCSCLVSTKIATGGRHRRRDRRLLSGISTAEIREILSIK